MHRPSIDPASKVVGKGPDGLMSIGTKSPGHSSSASGTSVANVGALTTDLQAISQQRVLIYNLLTALQSWSTYVHNKTTQLQSIQNSLMQTNKPARQQSLPQFIPPGDSRFTLLNFYLALILCWRSM